MKQGSSNLRNIAKVVNLPDPISGTEPALAMNVIPKIITGKIVSNQTRPGAGTTFNTIAGQAQVSIIEIKYAITINAILTEITTVSAPSGYRNALYSLDNNSYLKNLIVDGGIDQGNTVLTVNIDTVPNTLIMPGVYGLINKCSNIITLRAVDRVNCSTFLGHTNAINLQSVNGYSVPFTWVANTPFPAIFPTLTPTYSYNNRILHCLRGI